MNLWLVNNTQYVLANGVAGAAYLANAFNDEPIKLVKQNVTKEYKPRLISADEAQRIIKENER